MYEPNRLTVFYAIQSRDKPTPRLREFHVCATHWVPNDTHEPSPNKPWTLSNNPYSETTPHNNGKWTNLWPKQWDSVKSSQHPNRQHRNRRYVVYRPSKWSQAAVEQATQSHLEGIPWQCFENCRYKEPPLCNRPSNNGSSRYSTQWDDIRDCVHLLPKVLSIQKELRAHRTGYGNHDSDKAKHECVTFGHPWTRTGSDTWWLSLPPWDSTTDVEMRYNGYSQGNEPESRQQVCP